MYFRYFGYYLPLEINVGHHLNKYESPSLKGCFVPGLVEIGLVVLDKNVTKT